MPPASSSEKGRRGDNVRFVWADLRFVCREAAPAPRMDTSGSAAARARMGVKRPSDDAATGAARASGGSGPSAEPSRLFVVCGRGRKLDELRALFGACGRIRHLHLALDRSNKSRGFAFLQYEDPADAARAIERFDQMTLEDGHVLKVSVAKEKPSGKLKRNQHARQEADERAINRNGMGAESMADGHAPGKRQRSSPPQMTIQTEPFVPSMGGRGPEARYVKRERLDEKYAARNTPQKMSAATSTSQPVMSMSDQSEVARVMEAMLAALEKQPASTLPHSDSTLTTMHAYRSAVSVTISDNGLGGKPLLPSASRESYVNVKMEEPSTDVITSSIGSVSLASTPKPHPQREQQPPRAVPVIPEPQRSGKAMLRRRRQSVDDSDSSGEDGHDSGGNRRKRSNTTVTPPPPPSSAPLVLKLAEPKVKIESPLWHTVKSGSRRGRGSFDASRKQCKRQPSDDDREEGRHRASKQQITSTAHYPSMNPQSAEGDNSIDALSDAFGSLAQTRLFFVSTRKFTLQELEAMFSVYGDFESVQIVKSFGKVKTMAYIKYSQASTAAGVVRSFADDSAVNSQDTENEDFIKLTFADSTRSHQQRAQSHIGTIMPAHHYDSRSPVMNTASSANLLPYDSSYQIEAITREDVHKEGENTWLLVLFDRFLPNHLLSSTVSECPGMEFVDIKLTKTTTESQNVAFVKFASEEYAEAAARELHQLELPVGSGIHLQALVIADPSQFSAAYGSVETRSSDNVDGDESDASRSTEDVDIGAVEARFAHLMRNNSNDQQYPSQPPAEHFPSERPVFTGPSHMLPFYPSVYPSAAHAAYGSSNMYNAAPPGMAFTMPMATAPPHYHHSIPPAPIYEGPPFGFNTWMESAPPYYPPPPSSSFQYPFVPHPRPDLPLAALPNPSYDTQSSRSNQEGKMHPRALSPTNSDASMSNGECSSEVVKAIAPTVFISTTQPVDVVVMMSALIECSGMVAFRKSPPSVGRDGCAFMAEFASERQASEAVEKLNGVVCQGTTLTAKKLSGERNAAQTGKWSTSRRKRQRVDARSRGRGEP